MTRRQRRLTAIGAAGAVLALAAGLVLFALRDQIVFFYSPMEITEKDLAPGTRVRLGGLVEDGSIERKSDGGVRFAVTDTAKSVTVDFHGILPDLFREGQGVVAHGRIDNSGVFIADEVLAKHDEKYMPPQVAKSLKNKGEAYVPKDGADSKPDASTAAQAPSPSPAGT
jgi:cytochrome c-type biogenesis protein CcmE